MAGNELSSKHESLHKVSISRIKREMHDVFYLSDDLVIASLDASNPSVIDCPTTVDGFLAIVVMTGEATVSINLNTYTVVPNNIIICSPERIVRILRCTPDASAYLVAFSKSFINSIQIDLATSQPVFMRFGKAPVIEAAPRDVEEIRQIFQLVKTMLCSDKETYRSEIIRSLFTTAFYVITELNCRDRLDRRTKTGRGEVIFNKFMELLQQYNTRERNVSFYAQQLNITPKYLSTVVREVSGRTAARWIDDSVILEAKTLLKYSGLSIQEIAARLNFSTQSFFGKYFKQHTGTSPSHFKRRG